MSPSAGAGHNNGIFPIVAGFSASISLTRVSDARIGKEWERVGVQPDIRTNPGDGLTVAHLAALDSLQRSATDPAQRAALTTARLSVDAQAHPRTVPARGIASATRTGRGERLDVHPQQRNSSHLRARREWRDAHGTELADGSSFVIPRIGDASVDLAP